MVELGGFCEKEAEFDGTREEWEAFNYCLAEDYYNAMIEEDFSSLGYLSAYFIKQMQYWMNYDGKINKDREKEIKEIQTGLFLTCKNRSFLEAVIQNGKAELAETFIQLGSRDVRLFSLCFTEVTEEFTILNEIFYSNNISYQEYVHFLKLIFAQIQKEYENLTNPLEKAQMLSIVKKNLQNVRYPEEYGSIKIKSIGNYPWIKEMK